MQERLISIPCLPSVVLFTSRDAILNVVSQIGFPCDGLLGKVRICFLFRPFKHTLVFN